MPEKMLEKLSELCIQLLALHAEARLKFLLNPKKAEQFIAASVSQK